MASTISRYDYSAMYGPTTGDKIRLADTDLIIEVERDFTTYGEEVKFGGGKVIRDGMGQSQTARSKGAVDTVDQRAGCRLQRYIQSRCWFNGWSHFKDRQSRKS